MRFFSFKDIDLSHLFWHKAYKNTDKELFEGGSDEEMKESEKEPTDGFKPDL